MNRTVAFVGLGAVTRNIHMPGLSQLRDRIRVVAGCDPDSAAREFARKNWGLAVFEDPRKMLEETRPEIACICTPPWLHREHVLLALEHGCHVFCEKPLADNLTDADEMIRTSMKSGRTVVVNNQFPAM